MKINKKRESIFEYIAGYINKHGYSPTIREIASALSISSTATVAYNIDKLKKEGRLEKVYSKNRTLSIKNSTKNKSINIPLLGKIAAGTPIFATESYEEIYSFPNNLFRGENLFILNVTGDSMIEAGIFNGDKIVVNEQSTAERGEIVVALINDEATVKRYFPENGKIRLQPENSSMSPIIVPNCKILGVVVGTIRQF